MSVFSTLKNACSWEENKSPTYKNFDQLDIGEHKIKQFAIKDTQYGTRIQVTIEDFYVFLPARFSDKITSESEIDELNATPCIMIYKGKEKNCIQLDFKLDTEEKASNEDDNDDGFQGDDANIDHVARDYDGRKKGLKHKKTDDDAGIDEVDGNTSSKPKKKKLTEEDEDEDEYEDEYEDEDKDVGLADLERQAREFYLEREINDRAKEIRAVFDIQDRLIQKHKNKN